MKKLIQYSGDSPVYAEGFSENCKRSCKGAIHILPRKPITVTDDEYAHIMKNKDLASKLKVLAEMKDDEGSEAKEAATAAPKAEEPSSPSPSVDVEEKSKAFGGEKQKKK